MVRKTLDTPQDTPPTHLSEKDTPFTQPKKREGWVHSPLRLIFP
jgi:hypothetical protein